MSWRKHPRGWFAAVAACLTASLAACGSTSVAPREYPRMPPALVADAPTGPAVVREELRPEPRLVAQRSESQVVTLRVAFDAGSAADPRGREGVTSIAARLMAEGGAGELSFSELSARLYPMAATIRAHVSRDQTVFVGQVHRDHLEGFYELFRDVLLRPRMGEADFERIRTQVRTALSVDLRNARDEELGKQALQWLMYEGHPYRHPSLGTVAGLERLRLDDVRAQRSRLFCAGRATVGVAGAFAAGFAERVARDVARLSSDACVGRARLPSPASVSASRVLIVHKPTAESVAVSMGMPFELTRAHADYPAMVLVAAWLGQHRQFIGRLMQAIRGQRGLNYGDYAYIEHFEQEGWSRFPVPNDGRRQQYFSIWLRPLRPETAHFAIRLAVRELRNLVSEGLSEDEFVRVRTFAERYFALYLQTASRRLGFAMDDTFYGVDEPYLARLRAAWSQLSAEQVNAAIRRHLEPDRLQIALVASDAEGLAAALASDTSSPITYRSAVPASVLEEDRSIIDYPLGIARDQITILPIEETFAE